MGNVSITTDMIARELVALIYDRVPKDYAVDRDAHTGRKSFRTSSDLRQPSKSITVIVPPDLWAATFDDASKKAFLPAAEAFVKHIKAVGHHGTFYNLEMPQGAYKIDHAKSHGAIMTFGGIYVRVLKVNGTEHDGMEFMFSVAFHQ